jgi:hypothetical protein
MICLSTLELCLGCILSILLYEGIGYLNRQIQKYFDQRLIQTIEKWKKERYP